ncbi:efflux RND transporter periplasmic adaptor subunit [Puia sp.]|jgi:RND family efflux transporter MFP subunit|uniref:efflux RND transporter periplasmic adaptor subunit n=1 Tax=Puia sp. TaxID=2045100 RepID=UPI002F4143D7
MITKTMIASFVLTGLFLAGCSSHPDKATGEQKVSTATVPTAAAPTQASTFVLRNGSLHTELRIPAELTAYREVDLYAKVNSYVKTLTVDVGSEVRAGQLLATLEAPELVSQLAAAESKYRSQQAIYESSNATYQRVLDASQTPGTISKNDVDIAVAKRNSDLAQMEAALSDFKASSTITGYLTIYAPFDGVISARNVNLGAYIGPSGKGSEMPIFTLQQQRHLRLVIEVPEAYKSFFKLNDRVRFTVRAFADRVFEGSISRRAGVMDKALRSEHVELDVQNDDGKLSPGMVAEAVIGLDSQPNSFVVPKGAVVNSTEGVFMVGDVNGVAQRVPVRVGMVGDTVVQVFGEKLIAGEKFVTKGSEELRNGSTLQ